MPRGAVGRQRDQVVADAGNLFDQVLAASSQRSMV
jgi:hypothetical protein